MRLLVSRLVYQTRSSEALLPEVPHECGKRRGTCSAASFRIVLVGRTHTKVELGAHAAHEPWVGCNRWKGMNQDS